MLLSRLLEALPDAAVDGALERREVEIAALVADSRESVPDAVFVAIRGQRADGHDFVTDAVAHGARAVVVDEDVDTGAIRVRVPDTRIALSRLAARFFGDPSSALHVVGVTGTNGKTTTTLLARAIFDACGRPCGLVGTLGAWYGDWTRSLHNTTPLPIELHETLARMRELGARAVAIEVSSHALSLHRVDDIRFEVGALTNLTRDHLDFHQTFSAYAAAKRRLFDLVKGVVIGVDDPLGARWAKELRAQGRAVLTYGTSDGADLQAREIELRPESSSFVLSGFGVEAPVEVPLIGRFNVSNVLCALAIAHSSGCDLMLAVHALHDAPPVPGRMERVAAEGLIAIVDYAHTPDALANLLQAARELTRRRVIVVFGCGGDRDQGKRPQMGAVAAGLADLAIVTNDNPRSEDPGAIADAILSGAPSGKLTRELDRRAAIRQAIAEAHEGDVVVVAGKGHEPYQIVGTERFPFDDREEVRSALALRAAGAVAT